MAKKKGGGAALKVGAVLAVVGGVATVVFLSQRAAAGKPSVSIKAEVVPSAYGVLSTASVPVTIKFTATVTGGVQPYTYNWTFGDGSAAAAGNPVNHTYTYEGNYTISVLVGDAVGESATGSGTIAVTSATFVALVGPQYAQTGSRFLLSAAVKDSSNLPLLNETVDFYQGTTRLGSAVTDNTGMADFNATAPSSPGSYSYTAQFSGVSGVLGPSTSNAVIVIVYAPLSVNIGAV